MNLEKSDELRMVEDLAARLFRPGEDPSWEDLAASGLLALTLPETAGGFGGGAREVHAVARALGAAASKVPLAACALVPGALLGSSAPEGLAGGSTRIGAALSGVQVVHGLCTGCATLPPAEFVAVAAGGEVRLLPAGGEVRTLFDGTEVMTANWSETEGELLLGGNAASEAIARASAVERLAHLSETAGAAEAAVALTARYLVERKQFGQRLADFQVLRHRLVDMMIAAQEIEALALHAALSIEAGAPGTEAMLAAALARAARSGRRIAEEAVQLHGGVGVTEEFHVSHVFRRLIHLGLAHRAPPSLPATRLLA